jgi:hypothetical protein
MRAAHTSAWVCAEAAAIVASARRWFRVTLSNTLDKSIAETSATTVSQ